MHLPAGRGLRDDLTLAHGSSVSRGVANEPLSPVAGPSIVPAVQWHLMVEPDGRRGPDNMAVDMALLEDADRLGSAWLRLYRWDPPCSYNFV